LPGLFHLRSAETGEGSLGQTVAQGDDKGRAIGVAGGFAGGEKDARVGLRGDVLSLLLSVGRKRV